jgi:hypothetical protein
MATDNLVSGDTLQLVPVPKGAKILALAFYNEALPAGCTGANLGYGGDPNAFLSTFTPTGEKIHFWPGSANTGDTQTYFGNTEGDDGDYCRRNIIKSGTYRRRQWVPLLMWQNVFDVNKWG